MSTTSFVPRRKQTVLMVALALALSAQAAQAFTENNAFAPKTLLVFSGSASDGGTIPGSRPFAPPVYLAAENRYVGLTQLGGNQWVGAYSQTFTGATLFQVGVDGSAYVSQALGGDIGQQISSLLLAPSGDIYVGSESALDETGANPGGLLFAIRGGQTYALAREGEELTATRFVPRGQFALDGNGRLFFGAATGTVTCISSSATRTTNNLLYNFVPASGTQLQPTANLCDFNEKIDRPVGNRTATTYAHHKGTAPRVTVWSETDQALYVLAGNSGSETNIEGVPSTDNSGKPVGTLFRIKADALAARLEADDADSIEVLHHFAKARDGELRSGTDYVSGMIEVGDYLYGTSYTATSTTSAAALGGTIWRIQKSVGTDSFEVVHRFSDGDAGDGSNPSGPLVRAADGNLYGTTTGDTRSFNTALTEATGAGTLFRITAPAGSSPTYEPLSYFDVTDSGARPVGLSTGPVVTGSDGARHQVLIGATRYGGNADDTITSRESVTGHGTLFTVDVPITEATLTRFTTSASVARPGTRPTLQWASTGTDSCVASGDWSGEQAASGSYRPAALNELRDYVFTIQCSGYSGTTESRSLTVSVIDGSGTDDDSHSGGGALAGGLLAALAVLGRRRVKRA